MRDKRSLLHLYEKVLPALATSIHAKLTAITPLFHDFLLEKVVDSWTQAPDARHEAPISLENGNVHYMGLRLRLEGFQRAGVPPFDVSQEFVFTLWRGGYSLGPDKKNIWEEKEYEHAWTATETEALAQRWCNEVIDSITLRLQELS